MWQESLRVCLAVTVVLGSAPTHAQAPASDPEVLKGIRQVDDGDYDAAILTLDAAARRLSRDPARVQEVAQAYLHLGVAYLGKGHEASARAQFREALGRVKDLNLSPEKFAPKVIEAFEQARAESARAAAAPAPAEPARPVAVDAGRPEKKGGSGKKVLIGGLVLAGVAGGVAAAGGSGGSSTPTPAPRQTENFSGILAGNETLTFPINVAAAGVLAATLNWAEPEARMAMDLIAGGTVVGTSLPVGSNGATLTVDVRPQGYQIRLRHSGGCGDEPSAAAAVQGVTVGRRATRPCSSSFNLSVLHP